MTKKKLTGFGVVLAAILGAIVSLNHPSKPSPTTPVDPGIPVYALVAHVCVRTCAPDANGIDHKIVAASVEIEGQPVVITDGAGNANLLNLVAGLYRVCASADHYKTFCADHRVPADGDVFLGLEPDVPPVVPIHVDGKVFRDATGAIWPWRGVTAFTLLRDYVAGTDIGPYLDRRRAAGANLVRVLTTMRNIAAFPPSAYSDEQLRAFLDVVHAHGLRAELVALADAGAWPLADQRRHTQRILDAVAGAGALDVVEVCNEPPDVKGPYNCADPAAVMAGVQRRAGVLLASGSYLARNGQLTVYDFATTHAERKPEWPRTAKDALELRDGYDGFAGVKRPVVNDEPMGADEIDQPGRRSAVADDFYWFAATAQLLGAGATFHSTAGITASEPGPVQAAAERAFFAGLQAIPVEAQTGRYTRGYLADCPLLHDDALALRTFCALRGNVADCVVIRPQAGWTAQARDGWRIVSTAGPRGSVLHLQR